MLQRLMREIEANNQRLGTSLQGLARQMEANNHGLRTTLRVMVLAATLYVISLVLAIVVVAFR